MHFHGPATILIQSRAAAVSDVLSSQDVNEIADSPAGSVPTALAVKSPAEAGISARATSPQSQATAVSFASVNRDGSVKFEKS